MILRGRLGLHIRFYKSEYICMYIEKQEVKKSNSDNFAERRGLWDKSGSLVKGGLTKTKTEKV